MLKLQLTAKGRLDARLMTAFTYLAGNEASIRSSTDEARLEASRTQPEDSVVNSSSSTPYSNLESRAADFREGAFSLDDMPNSSGQASPGEADAADVAQAKAERAVGLRIAELLFGGPVRLRLVLFPGLMQTSGMQACT